MTVRDKICDLNIAGVTPFELQEELRNDIMPDYSG